MEAEWMKSIQSETICNFFYVFFIMYAIFFVIALVVMVGGLMAMKKGGLLAIVTGLQGVIMAGLAGTMALFYYLICDRALLDGAKAKAKPAMME